MKLPAIVSAILALIAIVLLFFIDFSQPGDAPRIAWERFQKAEGERKTAIVEEFLEGRSLPAGRETEILKWIFAENKEDLIQVIRDNSIAFVRLPKHLSDAIIGLIKEQKREAGLRALVFSRQLFPNDPDVLASAGIVAVLAGRNEDARELLEQAATWQKPNIQADFYLGGLLIQSDSVVDQARGKNLLLRVTSQGDDELKQLAALIMLVNPDIPILPQEQRDLLLQLKELGAFRIDNSNLNPDAVRLLTNTAGRVAPDVAMELAQLLLQYPDTNLNDRIGMIRLAQELEDYQMADELLSKIGEDPALQPDEEQQAVLARAKAFNDLALGRTAEAVAQLKQLCQSQPDEPQLHELFRRALQLELGIETQRQFLPLYLELPVLNARFSLVIAGQLSEVYPLRKDDWMNYVTKKVLPEAPVATAQWMIAQNAAKKVVEAIGEIQGPLSREQSIALTEAFIEMDMPQQALSILQAAGNKIEAVRNQFFRARIAHLQGEDEAAQEYWIAAQNAALSTNAYEMMKVLGFLAIDLDQPVNALQTLYSAFSAGVPFAPSEAARLIELTLKYGSLNQSMQIAAYLKNNYPDEPVFINNLAYFKFLAEEDLDEQVEAMRKIVDEYPDIHQYRLTLALGLIKIGRNNEAMRLLQSNPLDLADISPQGQLIYAAVLAANGQELAASGLIQSLDEETLIPEERALLDSL